MYCFVLLASRNGCTSSVCQAHFLTNRVATRTNLSERSFTALPRSGSGTLVCFFSLPTDTKAYLGDLGNILHILKLLVGTQHPVTCLKASCCPAVLCSPDWRAEQLSPLIFPSTPASPKPNHEEPRWRDGELLQTWSKHCTNRHSLRFTSYLQSQNKLQNWTCGLWTKGL